MVNLEKIREVMVAQLEEDKSRVFVEVSGVTLEDAPFRRINTTRYFSTKNKL